MTIIKLLNKSWPISLDFEAIDRRAEAPTTSPTWDDHVTACENAAALACEVSYLRMLILEVEWGGKFNDKFDMKARCPWCDEFRSNGHDPSCPIRDIVTT